jgi:hypothetical protein
MPNYFCEVKIEAFFPPYTKHKIQSIPHITSKQKMPAMTRSQLKTVSPVAITPAMPDYKKRAAERKEAARQQMMLAAIPKLAYMKSMLALIETAPASPDVSICRIEILAGFNTKIQELELDAAGLPRYIYTLSYEMDNGDETTCDQKHFNTSQEVHEFIHNWLLSDDGKDEFDYSEKNYTVPSAAEIDSIMEANKYNNPKQILFIGEEFLNSVDFKLKRTQVNY